MVDQVLGGGVRRGVGGEGRRGERQRVLGTEVTGMGDKPRGRGGEGGGGRERW